MRGKITTFLFLLFPRFVLTSKMSYPQKKLVEFIFIYPQMSHDIYIKKVTFTQPKKKWSQNKGHSSTINITLKKYSSYSRDNITKLISALTKLLKYGGEKSHDTNRMPTVARVKWGNNRNGPLFQPSTFNGNVSKISESSCAFAKFLSANNLWEEMVGGVRLLHLAEWRQPPILSFLLEWPLNFNVLQIFK